MTIYFDNEPQENENTDTGAPDKLSLGDRQILDSYKTTMDGLANFFGDSFEFVLHDVTDNDHSIIKIINGHHSKRKAGAPIRGHGQSMLNRILKEKNPRPYLSYSAKNKFGKPVRSLTTIIFGARKNPIGLLCINIYLDSLINSFFLSLPLEPHPDSITENYTGDSHELISLELEKAKLEVLDDKTIPLHLQNKEIVTTLYHQGIFSFKNAVKLVAKNLNISKNAVYFHIRTLEEKAPRW